MANKVAIVSVHSKMYDALSAITWDKNKGLYCTRHGFLGINETVHIPREHTGFAKIKLMYIVMLSRPDIEWVWGLGCDTMITNFENNLDHMLDRRPECCLLIATDRNGINIDSILVKNNEQGRTLVHRILMDEQDHGNEQGALQFILDGANEGSLASDEFEILPQRSMNAYNYDLYPEPQNRFDKLGTDGHWQKGDLLIHWPGFSDHPERRIAWAQEMLSNVIQ